MPPKKILMMIKKLVPVVLVFGLLGSLCKMLIAQEMPEVDAALVISVDVSNSVDENRYKLQLEGIAKAFEDKTVIDAILSGGQGGILISLVAWADRPKLVIPWTRIVSQEDSLKIASLVRKLPREGGEFTCVSGMMRMIADKIVTQIPGKPSRIIVDVSGDGKDNCNGQEPLEDVRDELVKSGIVINGLPILEGEDGASLEGWYRDYLIGGPGAFVLPAKGYGDFERAIRQKFVMEISYLKK